MYRSFWKFSKAIPDVKGRLTDIELLYVMADIHNTRFFHLPEDTGFHGGYIVVS
jgi:hypothetical protein